MEGQPGRLERTVPGVRELATSELGCLRRTCEDQPPALARDGPGLADRLPGRAGTKVHVW
jgi:hypothetical protein